MPGKDDNTARKLKPEHVDTSDVDAGWELEQPEKTPVSKQKPKDDVVERGTSRIQSLIEETLEEGQPLPPLELKELKQLGKNGEELLAELLADKPQNAKKQPVFIESGDKEEVKKSVPLNGDKIYVRCQTNPGQKIEKKEGTDQYQVVDVDKAQKHRDGVVIDVDKQKHRVMIGLTHALGSHQRDKVLAHLGATSIAYDSSAFHHVAPLDEMANHVNEQTKSINQKFKVPSKEGVSLLVAQLDQTYGLDVLSAGNWHCLVIDPDRGEVRSSRVQTAEEDAMGNLSQKATEEWVQKQEGVVNLSPEEMDRLREGTSRKEVESKIYDATPMNKWFDDPTQRVTMAANTDAFAPKVQSFETNAGDVVVFLSGPAMQALKDNDRKFLKAFAENQKRFKEMTQDQFADHYFGLKIRQELKKGRSLEEVLDELAQKAKNYRELVEYPQNLGASGGAVDTTTTIVGFTIPEKI